MGRIVECKWFRCPHCGYLDLTVFRYCPNHDQPRPLFERVPATWYHALTAAYTLGGIEAARELAYTLGGIEAARELAGTLP